MIKTNKNGLRATAVEMLVVCLASLSVFAPALAQTSEQLRQLQNLSPAQRAAILQAVDESENPPAARISEPEVVSPRRLPADDDAALPTSGQDATDTPANANQARGLQPNLKPFGYDLFAGEPTTFAPATDIPIPVDYVIGPGDTIELQLYGSQNAFYTLVVTREGILNVPDLGPITVSGLRFSALRETLQQRVADQMIGVSASITMGQLRSIRVFILGDAYRPGSYTVSALSTMTNALFVSGGINTIGSLRNIQLKRNGRLVTTIDLYDLLLNGDTSGDARLQPGDVIFIPPVGKTAGVAGEVRRPAIYELKNEKSVGDVLELAGGLLATAYPSAARIERINEAHERTVIDIDLTEPSGHAAIVQSDDVIQVASVLEKREEIVLLSGQVQRGGPFQWQRGIRLTDLITSLDDLLPGADPGYVLIRRESPNSLQVEALSADLAAALANRGQPQDVLLQPRDQVFVLGIESNRSDALESLVEELRGQSSRTSPAQVVRVVGRVRAPGEYPLEKEMRVSDLIRAGGSLAEEAYALQAELTRHSLRADDSRQTELISIDLDRILAGDFGADLLLESYDVLNIKETPNWRASESITVEGEVRFPGTYTIRRGERLSSVIERAGGLTDTAFAEGAIFLRKELRVREQEQLEELAERLESESAIATAAGSNDPEIAAARQALVDQLQATVATGRLVIDLAGIISGPGGSDLDVVLQHEDRLLVPQESQTVTIVGEVQYPTSHIFESGVNRNAYIDKSGGPTQNADERRIYIVRANGAVVANTGSRFFRSRGGAEMRPGDTIVVPLDADRMNKLTLWTNVSTVIYNIGVAAAAVASF